MEMLKESGYTVKDACNALGISRSSYYSCKGARDIEVAASRCQDNNLLREIKEIKAEHPFWRVRRVTAWLRHREGFRVNHKTVHKAKRTPQRNKPRSEKPRQYWGIDMTKFMVSSIGWVYLVIVLDWYTKKIVGWDLSLMTMVASPHRPHL